MLTKSQRECFPDIFLKYSSNCLQRFWAARTPTFDSGEKFDIGKFRLGKSKSTRIGMGILPSGLLKILSSLHLVGFRRYLLNEWMDAWMDRWTSRGKEETDFSGWAGQWWPCYRIPMSPKCWTAAGSQRHYLILHQLHLAVHKLNSLMCYLEVRAGARSQEDWIPPSPLKIL